MLRLIMLESGIDDNNDRHESPSPTPPEPA